MSTNITAEQLQSLLVLLSNAPESLSNILTSVQENSKKQISQLTETVEKLTDKIKTLEEKNEEKPVIQRDDFIYSEFSLYNDDKFNWENIEENEAFADGKYTLEKCASDMCRCVRRLTGSTDFVIKIEDDDGNPKLSYLYGTQFEKLAKMVKCYDEELCKDKRNHPTAYTAFEKYKTHFNITAVRFYSKNPKHVSLYHGLYYRIDIPITEIKMDLIQLWLDHTKYIICNGNEELYNYVLDWISFIIKNPNGQTGTVLCITGEQGCGKNTFTKALQEMLRNYTRVLEDIDHILGRWNSLMENKKLIIGNEIAAFGEGQKTVWNKFKHMVTEDEVTFEEKNEPKRQSENYLNFILVSNNDIIAPIEKTDRRFLVIKVPSKYVQLDSDADEEKLEKLKYFEELYSKMGKYDDTGKFIPDKEFYDNLTSYFKNREYTPKFNPRKLPETKEKKLIQDQFKSYIEDFIEDNYDELTREHGINKNILMNNDELTKAYRKPGQSIIQFIRQLNKYCLKYNDNGQRVDYYYNGMKNVYFYKLTPEYEAKFKPNLAADLAITESKDSCLANEDE